MSLTELREAAATAEANVENVSAEVTALEVAEVVDKAAVKEKKAELRKATSAFKKATKLVEKELEKAAKADVKAEKQIEKEAKAEERLKAKLSKEAAKQAKITQREANRMPEQNGVRRPKPATKCGSVWAYADSLSANLGQPVPIATLLETTNLNGLNEGNVKAEYARWRKFNGVSGRIVAPKAETEAA